MHNTTWDVIIIGAGPAGLAAAQMLGRARRRTLVLDAGEGRNRFAEHMHGVVGFDGVAPEQLRERGRAEAEAYGVEFRAATVEAVERAAAGLRIRLAGEQLTARAVIVATGVTDVLPAVPGLAERWGKSVLHCPYCHGYEVRDGRLGVLVTSDLGLHQAQLVRQWSDQLTVFAGGALDENGDRIVEPVAVPEDVLERLHARGVRVERERVVTAVQGEGVGMRAVLLDDGELVETDALFTAGAFAPHDGFLEPLGLARAETPFGTLLEVDANGQTSHPRVWAVGNVVAPSANVPVALGAGSMAGALANAVLVGDDADAAVAVEFWESRYGAAEQIWSGKVNRVLADVAGQLDAGVALDLGSGEGADALWLAEHGWRVTGIDISPTAVAHARAAAEARGLVDAVEFVAAEVGSGLESLGSAEFDLVAASFFQSPLALDRVGALRTAAARIRPGGYLLLTSHAGAPSWHRPEAHAAAPPHDDAANASGPHHFIQPEQELAQLELPADDWQVLACELRTRSVTSPDGEPGTIDDSVLLLRRTP